MEKAANIDQYIAAFPTETRRVLEHLRAAIWSAAPGATELISYGMPAFSLDGMLVWFAAHKTHIGFYPRGSGIEQFAAELASYRVSKGTVQFPLDRPLPLDLIAKIVAFRVEENRQRAAAKRGTRHR